MTEEMSSPTRAEKIAERRASRTARVERFGDRLAARGITITGKYLGGHPDHQRAKAATLQLNEAGVTVRVFKPFIQLPWAEVIGLEAEGPDQVQTRFTATRLVLMGPLGLAFKQKKKVGYIVVRGGFGEFIFEVDGKTPVELRAKIAPWAARLAPEPEEAPAPSVDRVDRVRELADLRDRGALTEEEFASEKARLLAGE